MTTLNSGSSGTTSRSKRVLSFDEETKRLVETMRETRRNMTPEKARELLSKLSAFDQDGNLKEG